MTLSAVVGGSSAFFRHAPEVPVYHHDDYLYAGPLYHHPDLDEFYRWRKRADAQTRTVALIPGFITLSFKVGSMSLYYFTLVTLAVSYVICRRIISSPLE